MFIKYLISVHHAVIVKEMSCAHGQMKNIFHYLFTASKINHLSYSHMVI